jgi:hypothetical protein
MASTTNAINATLYDKLNLNFIRDIAPVAGMIRAPFVMDSRTIVAARDLSPSRPSSAACMTAIRARERPALASPIGQSRTSVRGRTSRHRKESAGR